MNLEATCLEMLHLRWQHIEHELQSLSQKRKDLEQEQRWIGDTLMQHDHEMKQQRSGKP